jgi:hypothetical protein
MGRLLGTSRRASRLLGARRRLAIAGLAFAGSLGATVAIAQATRPGSPHGGGTAPATPVSLIAGRLLARTAAHTATPPRAPRGLAGPEGLSGVAGVTGTIGPAGLTGPPGPPGIINQTISIDWQNGAYPGQDSASFVAPGIGRGEVVCSLNTEWVNFTPYDQNADSEMWAAITRGEEVTVRAAARRATSWGKEFNLGLNVVNGTEPESQGSMVGIISSRGQFGSHGEVVPPPTTFHLSWYWSFADGYGPRCYVAGIFATGR